MIPATSQVDLSKLEHEILEFWAKGDIFQKSNSSRQAKKEFAFYDGPPFANGLPHYGHLLANTVKDTVPRYWNMRGYHVERRFGWDCHGLPVEVEIEKQEKLKGRTDILKLGIDVFNEKCRASVLHYAEQWQTVITRLGRWVDWNHQYRTMDVDFMESVWFVFKTLMDKGLVYRGHKVVPYSPRITAVLSNFEANQNYKDTQDPALTVKFASADGSAFLLAWTTTPWTLVSNLALAVGADIDYVKIHDHKTDEHYILAQARLGDLYSDAADYTVVGTVRGEALVGQSYTPLFPYFADQSQAFKVLAGDFVATDSGTGIVHCAPAFGEDDHKLCTQHQIDLVDPLDAEARFGAQCPEYEGMSFKEADKAIIRDLKQAGKVLKHATIVHSYPFCDRTEEPLIYRAIPAWFVNVEAIKQQLVDNNQKIHWVPEHLKNGRMGKWLENARDWAISRNRFWGTPIPIWLCEHDDSHRVTLGSRQELCDKTGQEINDLHKHFIDDLTISCPECSGTMRRIPEVFDCWFESGSMPYAQLHYPFENKERFEGRFPADFIAEGLDQTRGWFYTLSILSTALFNKPAFKNVVVNGLVLAEDGKKMSKRLRNYAPPQDLMEQFGADSVRLYMLQSAILRGEDLKFSQQGVKDTTRAVILPLWNCYAFLSTYAHADGWKPSSSLKSGAVPQVEQLLDRWIISRFQSLCASVSREMDAYRLYNVVPWLLGFIDELTNWYIRLNRRRFWSEGETISEDSQAAYETLYYVIFGFVRVFAPFAPFISEAIYLRLTDHGQDTQESVHLHDYPMAQEDLADQDLEARMQLLQRVIELGRSLRAKHQIKTRQPLASMLVISPDPADLAFVEANQGIIKSELNVKDIQLHSDESQFVAMSLKPNLRTLGRKLGKDLKAFRTYLADLNDAQPDLKAFLTTVEAGQGLWQGHEILGDDLLVERVQKDERLVASEQDLTVLLDTKLTPELQKEGLAREFINRLQNLRRDSGLEVSHRICVKISCSDQSFITALQENQAYIMQELLATQLDYVSELEGVGESFEVDGFVFKVVLSKVS